MDIMGAGGRRIWWVWECRQIAHLLCQTVENMGDLGPGGALYD